MPTRPTCANPRCRNRRRRGHLMCRLCWLAVPADIRSAVYAAYNPAAGLQNAEWLAAAEAAIESLRTEQA